VSVSEQILHNQDQPQLMGRPSQRIGSILAREAGLSSRELQQIMDLQQAEGLRFGQAALRLGLITVDDLQRALAIQYDVPHLMPDNGRVNSELVVAYQPFDPCAEQLRTLRTQLQIRWVNNAVRKRMLAIVSPGPQEGRSYVAANLAVAFSQLGQRTLIIDADLRNPRQHRIFDVANRVGLSALLSGRSDRSAIVSVPEFGRLYVLPAGARPPNPLELLSGDRFERLLQEVQTDFDVILLDTPAAKRTADAQSVAFRAGSALVLARRDHTHISDTGLVVRQIDNTGATTVGTVFNAF
jgi:chain length determinant protein tyrosine kinase EpsG